MIAEHHLILQEMTLRPASEWTPQARGWLVARVAEGAGYWRQNGTARELNVGDGFVMDQSSQALVRASMLGPLKLQFFTVQPQYLNGVLTVAEWHQLVEAGRRASYVAVFSAHEPIAQKFSRVAGQAGVDGLALRCDLLQVWSNLLSDLLAQPEAGAADSKKLRERFRRLLGKLTEAELAVASLTDLAGRLDCSERHFNRLFREEYGMTLRARQTELRLQRASELLTTSNVKIASVAQASGYRHLGLFNLMFKKQFGMTPSRWRQACP